VTGQTTLHIDLHDSTGNTIATNDDWQTAINANQIPVAFQHADSHELATLATLLPGSFTAILRGKNGGSGVGLIEMNDLSTAAASKLTNVSTRGFVGTGENVMIGGFILNGGSGERQILIRALGPTLAQAPFNIAGSLTDPTLILVDGNGTVVASNDDWKSSQQNEIQATGLGPPNGREGGDSYDFAYRQFRRSFPVKTERRAWRISTSFIRFDDVTIENKTFKDLANPELKYVIFFTRERLGVKADPTKRQRNGSFSIDLLKPHEKKSFSTDPVE